MRRHRSIHEVDISDLEAALRSDDPGKVHETPREEIARLRKMELEPQHYDVDINKEVRPGGTSTGLGHPRCRRVDPIPASCRILEPKRVPVRVVGAGGGRGRWVLAWGRVLVATAQFSPSCCPPAIHAGQSPHPRAVHRAGARHAAQPRRDEGEAEEGGKDKNPHCQVQVRLRHPQPTCAPSPAPHCTPPPRAAPDTEVPLSPQPAERHPPGRGGGGHPPGPRNAAAGAGEEDRDLVRAGC